MDTFPALSEKIKHLSLLDSLSEDSYRKIISKLEIHHLPTGEILFSQGETDKAYVFLLEGSVNLFNQKEKLPEIKGGTDDAYLPLAHSQPRAFTAKASTKVTYLKIETRTLDMTIAWERSRHYKVTEITENVNSDSDDWMTRLLSKPVFYHTSPKILQSIFSKMVIVNVSKGDIIIRQGEAIDYFYIIASGNALVTHKVANQPKVKNLAILKSGDTFGEDALISKRPRSATIQMISDGTLMRLKPEDFTSLLNPVMQYVSYETAETMATEQNAQWLDVRLPSEFAKNHLQNAINLPLLLLRHLFQSSIDSNRTYITYCDTSERSAAAAFFLKQNGVNAYILEDGLKGKTTHPAGEQQQSA